MVKILGHVFENLGDLGALITAIDLVVILRLCIYFCLKTKQI